jgi:hypothetical protein
MVTTEKLPKRKRMVARAVKLKYRAIEYLSKHGVDIGLGEDGE